MPWIPTGDNYNTSSLTPTGAFTKKKQTNKLFATLYLKVISSKKKEEEEEEEET